MVTQRVFQEREMELVDMCTQRNSPSDRTSERFLFFYFT
jgi:hypothetical protein